MKYICYVLLIFISGCSHSLFHSREYDVRNTILEKPLVIPSNVYSFKYEGNHSINNIDDDNSSFLNILLSGKLSSDSVNDKDILSHDDIIFLKLLKSENGYPNIRNEINQESLSIAIKNKKFINKILNWQIDESLIDPINEYKSLNNK